MEIIQIITPIITFALGALLSFFYWKIDNKNKKEKEIVQKEKESIQEVANLSNEWYKQLYDVHTNKLKIDEYSQNRIILPKLRQHIEFLREKRKYEDFVEAADEFLSIVTHIEKDEKPCEIQTYKCNSVRLGLTAILSMVDKKEQELSVLAAKILSRL